MDVKFIKWKKAVSLLLAVSLAFCDTASLRAFAAETKPEIAEEESAENITAEGGEDIAESPVLKAAERKDTIEQGEDGWLKRSKPSVEWEPEINSSAVSAGAFSYSAGAVSGSGMTGHIDSGIRVRSLNDQPGYFAKDTDSLPSKYDAREKGTVTPVKNQELFGLCWAFATLSASEANALSDKLGVMDFSELALGYYTYNRVGRSDYGNTIGDSVQLPGSSLWTDAGGNEFISMWALANWMMPLGEELAPYVDTYKYADGSSSYEEAIAKASVEAEEVVTKKEVEENLYKSAVHLQNAYVVSQQDRDEIKKLIMNYGAVGSAYFDITDYHNDLTNSYYQNMTDGSNHEITIAGWDDNYDKSNFNADCQPGKNGAWLIKNSWGDTWGDAGYFWISYEDPSLSDAFAYDVEPSDNYENIYQYDGGSTYNGIGYKRDKIFGANVYTAVGDESLRAVSFGTMDPNMDYSIQIYKNPNAGNPESGTKMLQTEKTGTALYMGYHTIPVDPVELKKGDTFSVVVKLSAKDGSDAFIWTDEDSAWEWVSFTGASEAGQSYVKYDGGSWIDFGDGIRNSGGAVTRKGNIRIKAFTVESIKIQGQPSEYLWKGDTVKLSVAGIQAGETVKWSSSDEKIATVDSDGLVTAVGYGEAIIKAKVGASSAEVKINVKSIEIVGEEELYVGKPQINYSVKLMPDETEYEVEEWASSDSRIAEIDSKSGAAFATGAGVVTFTAKTKDGKEITKKVTCYLESEEISVSADRVVFENENDKPKTVTASVKPDGANQKILWTSKDKSIAEVSDTGEITPKKAGETVVTAASAFYPDVKKEIEVTVKGIDLNASEIDLSEQDSYQLKAKLYGLDEDSTSWEIKEGSDAVTLIETENKNEILVEAKAGSAGKTAVIAVKNGSYYKECKINVKQLNVELKSLTLNVKKADLVVGEDKSVQLRAAIIPEDIPLTFVKWSSSNEKIAKVSESGEVTGTGEEFGNVTITATASLNGVTKTASCMITVYSVSPSEKLSAEEAAVLLEKSQNYTSEKVVKIINQDNQQLDNSLFDWSSSNTAVCTVDSEGRMKAAGKGNAVITALLKGDPAKRKVTVKAEVVDEAQILKINVTRPGETEAVGSCTDPFLEAQPLTYQFAAAAKMTDGTAYGGDFAWTVSDKSVAAVKYDKASKTATVTVKKPAFFSVICTAKDKAKTSEEVEIYAYQFNPVVDSKNLTVNTNFEIQKNEVTGNTETVSTYFTMKTITGTAIDAKSLSVQIVKKGASSGEKGYISGSRDSYNLYVPKTMQKGKYIARITGKVNIEDAVLKQKVGETADILVEIPLTVENSLPKVKLNATFNTYYKNGEALITSNLYSWEIEEIKDSSDTGFTSKYKVQDRNYAYYLSAVNGYDTKLKSGKVIIKLEDYEPFETNISIKYGNSKPVLKITDKPLINVKGYNFIPVTVLEKYGKGFYPYETLSKEDIDLSKAAASSDNDKFQILDVDDGMVILGFKDTQPMANKAYKLVLPVQKPDWSAPIELKVTVKTTNADVKTKLGSSTVMINQAAGIRPEYAGTSILYDQSNIEPDSISILGMPEGLDVDFYSDEIFFKVIGNIPNKTYSLQLTPEKKDGAYEFKPVTLKLKVGEFTPQVTIKGKGTLDLINRETTSMQMSFSVKNIGSAISKIELDPVSAEDFSYDYGILTLKDDAELNKGKQNVRFVITLESGQRLYKNFSVNLKQTLPKLNKMSAPVLHKTVKSKEVWVYGYAIQKNTDSAEIDSIEVIAPKGIKVSPENTDVYTSSFFFTLDASNSTLKSGKYKVKVKVYFEGAEKTAKYPKGQPVEQTMTVTVAE